MGSAPLAGRSGGRGMSARYQQVADDLRRQIGSGSVAVGERLPSERELASYYRVSVPTLRDALALLQVEGLVEKIQGRGNFVRAPFRRIEYPGAVGRDLYVTASVGETTATGDLAARLGSPPGAPVTEYLYVAYRDNVPHNLASVYVPQSISRFTVPARGRSPWGDDVLGRLARRAGVSVACETHQVTARFPTDTEAQSLRVSTRTPVLAVERTLLTDSGPVAAYALLVLPGDRAQVAFATGDFRKESPDGYDPAGTPGGRRS